MPLPSSVPFCFSVHPPGIVSQAPVVFSCTREYDAMQRMCGVLPRGGNVQEFGGGHGGLTRLRF